MLLRELAPTTGTHVLLHSMELCWLLLSVWEKKTGEWTWTCFDTSQRIIEQITTISTAIPSKYRRHLFSTALLNVKHMCSWTSSYLQGTGSRTPREYNIWGCSSPSSEYQVVYKTWSNLCTSSCLLQVIFRVFIILVQWQCYVNSCSGSFRD